MICLLAISASAALIVVVEVGRSSHREAGKGVGAMGYNTSVSLACALFTNGMNTALWYLITYLNKREKHKTQTVTPTPLQRPHAQPHRTL